MQTVFSSILLYYTSDYWVNIFEHTYTIDIVSVCFLVCSKNGQTIAFR